LLTQSPDSEPRSTQQNSTRARRAVVRTDLGQLRERRAGLVSAVEVRSCIPSVGWLLILCTPDVLVNFREAKKSSNDQVSSDIGALHWQPLLAERPPLTSASSTFVSAAQVLPRVARRGFFRAGVAGEVLGRAVWFARVGQVFILASPNICIVGGP
jgi:hypothetical protein